MSEATRRFFHCQKLKINIIVLLLFKLLRNVSILLLKSYYLYICMYFIQMSEATRTSPNKEKFAFKIENAVLSQISITNINKDIPEGSMGTETKNVSAWSIVYTENDEEDCIDGFNDIIPSS